MYRMPCKPRSLPYQTPFLRQQGWHLPAHQLIADRFPAIWVQLALITHLPRATRAAVIVAHAVLRRPKFGSVRIEGIAIFILCTPHLPSSLPRIDLKDGVGGTVNVGIDPHAEEVLVIMCVHARVDLCAPPFRVFARVHGVGIEDAGEFDLELDGAVLVEDPVDAVLVVGRREDVRDEKLSSSCHDDGVISEVGMLEQDPRVFFMDADGVLDGLRRASFVNEISVHVVDGALTVTSQSETVGHVAAAVFTQVEGMFAVMWVFRVAVGDNHFGEGEAVEDAPFGALIIVSDVVEDDAFAVVEADVDLPILPFDEPVLDGERDAFRLSDVDWFEVLAVAARGLDCCRMVVVWGSFVDWSANWWNVDVGDFLCVTVEDGDEVEGV